MPDDCIPFRETGYFSALINDYLDQKEAIKPLFRRFPTLDNFEAQLAEKAASYPAKHRETLAAALQSQYRNTAASEQTTKNIELLKQDNTYTVTTGHQLNLFTGPLYFLYKIVSTIHLCRQLAERYPDKHFVPVYWMATEDHDFDEINHFSFRGKKLVWERADGGAVGRFSTEGLQAVLDDFAKEIGPSKRAKELLDLFRKSYVNHKNLADATRCLTNELFGTYGLVILDADQRELKTLFAPYMKNDLLHHKAAKKVEQSSQQLADNGYKVQVNPREINLFYLQDGARERIVKQDGHYSVLNSALSFTETELLTELKQHPQHFSPNVLLRPLYQEVILPNLCYIGGGGELAYWLQLHSFFESESVVFPLLLLRDSALLMPEKVAKKLDKLPIEPRELFLKKHLLETRVTKRLSDIPIDLSPQREHLKKQFEDLYKTAAQTDASFVGAVAAQEKKQRNGLDKLEKRLLKAQKRKMSELLGHITELREELFPGGSLQERSENFAEWYLKSDGELVERLMDRLKTPGKGFWLLRV